MREGIIGFTSWLRRMCMVLALVFLAMSVRGEGEDAFLLGNKYYEQGEYDSAAMVYEAIVASGQYNAEVYYNLGNAYYRKAQYAKAILNYERALKVAPSHDDAESNLKLARTFAQDRVTMPVEWPIVRWLKGIPLWFTERGWGWVSLASFTVVAVLLLLFKFYVGRRQWALAGAGVLLFVVVGAVAFYFSRRHYHIINTPESAIVMQSVVSVKSSPDAASKDLFLLHAGTKVRLLENIGGWREVALPNGERGWVEESTIEGI